jgi:hypothetical protein
VQASEAQAFGVLTLGTGTTNNNTGYASYGTSTDILVGVPTPGVSAVCVYESEYAFRTGAAIPAAGTQGYIRVGFNGSFTGLASNGMYLEYLVNGTTNDTTWWWVNRNNGVETRTQCVGTSLAINTYYWIKLRVTRATSGDMTFEWWVNGASGSFTVTNANVGTANVPVGTNRSFGFGAIESKAGTAHATTQVLEHDFVAWRIRRPFAPTYSPTLFVA